MWIFLLHPWPHPDICYLSNFCYSTEMLHLCLICILSVFSEPSLLSAQWLWSLACLWRGKERIDGARGYQEGCSSEAKGWYGTAREGCNHRENTGDWKHFPKGKLWRKRQHSQTQHLLYLHCSSTERAHENMMSLYPFILREKVAVGKLLSG